MLDQILEVFEVESQYNLDIMEKNQSLARLTEKVVFPVPPLPLATVIVMLVVNR